MFLAVRDATCKRHACSGTNCGASRGEVAARCALRRKFKIQNQANLPGTLRLAYSRFGAQPAEGAHDCTELRASAAGGCGPHGPDGPIQTRDKPAAERTGLLSSSARMQPSARGRLRAAGPDGPNLQTNTATAINAADPSPNRYPTDPSRLIANSFCASTANSIGSFDSTSRA